MLRKRLRTLTLGSTAIGFALSGGAAAQPVEEVIITGSHIRGVAPVGSTLVQVGQEELVKTGAAATTDLLMRVPQVINLGLNEQAQGGGARLQGAAGNTTFTRSINLRGIGSTSTLSLFNGMRHTANRLSDATDIDVYPIPLVERVEVLADGASATYGSDAVAGTVNVILKKPFDAIETTFQVGLKDGSMDWQALQTLGTTWDAAGSGIGDGGVTITYMHSYIDPIDAADRPDLYNDDLTAYLGAAGALREFASPGNVRGFGATATTQAVLYAVPTGVGSTTPLNLSQLAQANTVNRQSRWLKAFPLPRITRDTIAGVFEQELTDWLTFSFFGNYMRRSGGATYGSQPDIQSTLRIGPNNPYSPCRAGAPADTTHTPALVCPANGVLSVPYSWTNEFQTSVHRDFFQVQHNLTGTFEFDLPYEWAGRFSGYHGKDYGIGTLNPQTNVQALEQIMGVTQTGAVATVTTKPANVPFFNPFCDNTAGPCNSAITVDYVRATSSNSNSNWMNQYTLSVDGPVFDLPGGTVRVALGGEWAKQSLIVDNFQTTQIAGGVRTSTGVSHSYQQWRAVFGEIYVPVVGAANAMPGIQELVLTLAARVTDYTAVGTTRDPKIGLNWTPFTGVKLRGSWGTSFRAPNPRENDIFAAASIFVDQTTCGAFTGINLAACPVGVATPLTIISTTGGNSGLTPETARTYNLGIDLTPEQIPGLSASLTYYHLKTKNRLAQPFTRGNGAAYANQGFNDAYIRFNPTYFPTRAVNNQPFPINGVSTPTVTQAQYDAFTTNIRNDVLYVGTAVPASPVVIMYDGRFVNAGELETSGLDYQARYDFETEWGAAYAGFGGSYTLQFDQSPTSAAPVLDRLNEFGYNTKFRVRGEAGITTNDGISVAFYVNHVGGYDVDAANLPAGAGAQFQTVDSYTTADLSLSYDTGEDIGIPLLRQIQVTGVVSNVFDTMPPFMLNGVGVPVTFDPAVGSAVGRMVTLRVTKRW